jgi:hypothetical protein
MNAYPPPERSIHHWEQTPGRLPWNILPAGLSLIVDLTLSLLARGSSSYDYGENCPAPRAAFVSFIQSYLKRSPIPTAWLEPYISSGICSRLLAGTLKDNLTTDFSSVTCTSFHNVCNYHTNNAERSACSCRHRGSSTSWLPVWSTPGKLILTIPSRCHLQQPWPPMGPSATRLLRH